MQAVLTMINATGIGVGGLLSFIVPAIILTYYAVIGGWITKYIAVFATGKGGYKNVLYPDLEVASEVCAQSIRDFEYEDDADDDFEYEYEEEDWDDEE